MRPEKQYLVEEVNNHLNKSDYVYLTNYERITVEEIAELRAQLSEHEAEFHVIKNSIFGNLKIILELIKLWSIVIHINNV